MGTLEHTLAEFVTALGLRSVPPEPQRVVRRVLLAVAGTGFAGAAEDGVLALRELLVDAGGAAQATVLVYGDRLPATAAAQLNGTVCRALDFCDAMAPGPHIGAALFPAALAAAELAGGCSGEEFLAALVAGAEISSRFNLSEAQYDGFDPTGIVVAFAAAAAASRILGLTTEQTLHALALAFNRCGGSFQSHVDGSLGVRVVQGWVAQAGVQCAQMAQRGITGPDNFLGGHYGFAHLYGRGTLDPASVTRGLGATWKLENVVFKKYPSCGVTQGVTELALGLVGELGLVPADVRSAEVRLPPYAHRLVGHAFRIGANPRVDAQFNAGYCVASAIVRGSSQLRHFAPAQVDDPAVRAMIGRVRVVADEALDARGHAAVDLAVTTSDGRTHVRRLDIPPGFPGNALDDAQHLARFRDCLAYAPQPPSAAQAEQLLQALDGLAALPDVRALLPLLVVDPATTRAREGQGR
ncbi:MAG TPA: MmgE/PrpD family protein [Caldimonas sp.]|jgi:2-methylcitrate dehydratase PrpD|nr:MmgE/PrpD family protein [Caldimonas sp.]HEX2542935.1 MmgE/PrpD family protein [Caldimonas sp.]